MKMGSAFLLRDSFEIRIKYQTLTLQAMKKTHQIVFALFLLAPFTVICQQETSPAFSVDQKNRVLGSIGNPIGASTPGFNRRTEDIKGTPYVFENWMDGKVLLKDGQEISGQGAFNVDALDHGGVLVLLPNGDIVDARESLINELQVTDAGKVRTFRPIKSSKLSGKDAGVWVVEVIYETDVFSFIKRHYKYIRHADNRGPYTAERDYHEYISEAEYYLGKNDNYTRIKLHKSSIEEVDKTLGSKLKGGITEEELVEAMKGE